MLPSESLVRLRPLFAVGIHDIPFLEELSKPPTQTENLNEEEESSSTQSNLQPLGWLACTTDEILVMKPALYDLVVEMPSTHLDQPAMQSEHRRRPLIKLAGSQHEIKATQRDWRRYKLLRRALRPLRKTLVSQGNGINHEIEEEEADEDQEEDSNSDTAPLLRSLTNLKDEDEDGDDEDERDLVEPTTWSELAYQGFMWWASAGEKDESTRDEETKDNGLLGDLARLARQKAEKTRYHDEDEDDSEDEPNQLLGDNSPLDDREKGRVDASVEMEIISYFHRITKSIFEVAQEHLSDDSNEDDEEFDRTTPRFDTEALRGMGLDAWSISDRVFVANFAELWFERDVRVDSGSVEWCGVRIC
jgi:hypothetical protein